MSQWTCSACGCTDRKKQVRGMCHRCYEREWRAARYKIDPEWRAKESKARYYANKEPFLRRARERNRQLKWDVIAKLGGICACCGETTLEFLTVDHINGNGAEHRRQVAGKTRSSSVMVYKDIRRRGFPTAEFQVLCFNCNCAKGCWGYCPHKPSPLRTYPPTFVGTSGK